MKHLLLALLTVLSFQVSFASLEPLDLTCDPYGLKYLCEYSVKLTPEQTRFFEDNFLNFERFKFRLEDHKPIVSIEVSESDFHHISRRDNFSNFANINKELDTRDSLESSGYEDSGKGDLRFQSEIFRSLKYGVDCQFYASPDFDVSSHHFSDCTFKYFFEN